MMYWLLLLIVPILLGVYAQMKVSSAYQKNLQIASRGGITGAEAAQAVISSAGINDVEIVEVEGHLSDHYDPTNRRLALSSANFRGTSLAALGDLDAVCRTGGIFFHRLWFLSAQLHGLDDDDDRYRGAFRADAFPAGDIAGGV